MLIRRAYLFIFLCITFFSRGQLSSFDVSGSSAMVTNLGNRLNGTRDVMLRYNQKIGWYFNGSLGIAYNVTRFNTLPRIANDYADLKNIYQAIQLGGSFNLLTAIRTWKKGGKSAVGLKEISLAHFKYYICGGAEFLKLKSSDDAGSYQKITNLYEGFGIEVYRMGRRAKTKYNALVPFFEARFFHNINGGYYSSPKGFVNFNKVVISLGFKFTYGLPEN